jgi:polyferredoxin
MGLYRNGEIVAAKTGKYTVPITILSIFLVSSAVTWYFTRSVFFLFDLPYIGFSVALGIAINIWQERKSSGTGRRITQLMVGLYFLIFLNLVIKVDMQIEGLFFQVLAGFFTGAFIHYAIAKLFGPAVFSRGFCGYACWTAMVLDFLPWKRPAGRIKGAGRFRYIHFFISFAGVVILIFALKYTIRTGSMESIYWFTLGNLLYYAAGITLAYVLKDNRAFCKYLCPVAVLMKVPARYSYFKFETDPAKCSLCKACEKICPMDIRITDYTKFSKRITSTECILCGECSSACPKKAIAITGGFDRTADEYINYRG